MYYALVSQNPLRFLYTALTNAVRQRLTINVWALQGVGFATENQLHLFAHQRPKAAGVTLAKKGLRYIAQAVNSQRSGTCLIVILKSQMSYQIFTAKMSQSVL